MKTALSIIFSVTILSSLIYPWVGVVAYYMLAILGPQYIWFWLFDDLRITFFVALFTIGGTIVSYVYSVNKSNFLFTRLNFYIVCLWGAVSLSYLFGEFIPLHQPDYGLTPYAILVLTSKIFIMYLCASFVINDEKKVICLACILAIVTVYMVLWANLQYFSGNWSQFANGRLKGPEVPDGGSIYGDENTFAMLFVAGLSFVYYFGFNFKRLALRLFSVVLIILGWHAVFLTGSRSGFLGLCASILVVIFRSRKKYLTALWLIPCFAIFFALHAGGTMQERAGSISASTEEDFSINARVTAWKGGLGMILEHPLTGVGVGSFITALPYYIESTPRVAHNSLVQFAAESGLIAGFAYIMIIIFFIRDSFYIGKVYEKSPEGDLKGRMINSINNACTAAFVGLVVCSMFLSLNNYEIFYFLLVCNNSMKVLSAEKDTVVF